MKIAPFYFVHLFFLSAHLFFFPSFLCSLFFIISYFFLPFLSCCLFLCIPPFPSFSLATCFAFLCRRRTPKFAKLWTNTCDTKLWVWGLTDIAYSRVTSGRRIGLTPAQISWGSFALFPASRACNLLVTEPSICTVFSEQKPTMMLAGTWCGWTTFCAESSSLLLSLVTLSGKIFWCGIIPLTSAEVGISIRVVLIATSHSYLSMNAKKFKMLSNDTQK